MITSAEAMMDIFFMRVIVAFRIYALNQLGRAGSVPSRRASPSRERDGLIVGARYVRSLRMQPVRNRFAPQVLIGTPQCMRNVR